MAHVGAPTPPCHGQVPRETRVLRGGAAQALVKPDQVYDAKEMVKVLGLNGREAPGSQLEASSGQSAGLLPAPAQGSPEQVPGHPEDRG